jgi:hypothetical protein
LWSEYLGQWFDELPELGDLIAEFGERSQQSV